MAVRIASHAPTEGKAVEIFLAILPKGVRKKPTKQTLTASAAAKGATSVTVSGISGEIQKGQYLLFKDTDGGEYLCQVDAKVAANATAITVKGLPEAIPASATAEFPVYLWDRKNADIDRSYNLADVSTFNTGGFKDGILTGGEKKLSLPGIYHPKNAGYYTAKYCSENRMEFWMIWTKPNPTDAYSAGDSVEGPAVCTGIKEAAPDDGFISCDMDIQFLGATTETDPVAVV